MDEGVNNQGDDPANKSHTASKSNHNQFRI
jgi:hypothetical protein